MTAKTSLLLVEDDRATLQLYVSFFTHYFPDVRVLAAVNPQEAMMLYKEHQPNVVVTDCRVPEKHDGLRIAETICAENSNAAVFIVTADANTVAKIVKEKEAGQHCIQAVLAKPVNLRDLTHRIEEILESLTDGG